MNVVVLGELCEDILMHNPNSVEVFEQKIWAKRHCDRWRLGGLCEPGPFQNGS